jgi:MoxR-like ATPase
VTLMTRTPAQTAERAAEVLNEIERAVVGHRRSLELVLIGILASGHILLEDQPGLGKTLTARSFARALGLDFARIQFTPDLLPSDVVGAPLYDQRTGEMVFRPGPVFTQLLLADEINRTPPKTQAALLEAMGEGPVSMDSVTRPLPQPFVVLATDNPIEYEGTYELPEAQLDRFIMRLRLGYLESNDEVAMLQRRLDRRTESAALRAVTTAEELIAMRHSLEQVEVSPDVLEYAVSIVRATSIPRSRSAPALAVRWPWYSWPAAGPCWACVTMSSPTTSRASRYRPSPTASRCGLSCGSDRSAPMTSWRGYWNRCPLRAPIPPRPDAEPCRPRPPAPPRGPQPCGPPGSAGGSPR